MNERLQRIMAFLREYRELCSKHRMYIDACGCCNSPWVAGDNETLEDEFIDGRAEHLVDGLCDDTGDNPLPGEVIKEILTEVMK